MVMFNKVFSLMIVLAVACFANAMDMAGQSNSIDAMLAGFNMTSGGPVTGGVVGQFGGTISATDGWGVAAGQQSGIAILAVNILGPGSAVTGAEVDATQVVASTGNAGNAAQGSNMGLMTALVKESGMGGVSATNSAVVNQAEIVNNLGGTISNSNTSGASTIASMGPCSTGTVMSCVDVENSQGSAFVNPCAPVIPCPPVCPPCPNPCGGC